MVAVTRRNLRELKEGEKLGVFSKPLINIALPLNLHGFMISYLHTLLWKITALQCSGEAVDHA